MSGTQAPPSPYLELLKVVLTDYYPDERLEYIPLPLLRETGKIKLLQWADRVLRSRNFAMTKVKFIRPDLRRQGYDWPAQACTMIGIGRLNNIEHCIRTIHEQRVAGDMVEAGVWRGGAILFMKAVLNELAIKDRIVWAADSFRGLPKPGKHRQKDASGSLYDERILRVSLEEVKRNIHRFNLLDDGIRFLEGEFADTLPTADIRSIALLRLDADMYDSTHCALLHLYPKVTPGGFVIVDDYNAFAECRQAVDEYRLTHGISDPIIELDKEAVYWQKSSKAT